MNFISPIIISGKCYRQYSIYQIPRDRRTIIDFELKNSSVNYSRQHFHGNEVFIHYRRVSRNICKFTIDMDKAYMKYDISSEKAISEETNNNLEAIRSNCREELLKLATV